MGTVILYLPLSWTLSLSTCAIASYLISGRKAFTGVKTSWEEEEEYKENRCLRDSLEWLSSLVQSEKCSSR